MLYSFALGLPRTQLEGMPVWFGARATHTCLRVCSTHPNLKFRLPSPFGVTAREGPAKNVCENPLHARSILGAVIASPAFSHETPCACLS